MRFSCKSRVLWLTASINQDDAFFSLEFKVKSFGFKASSG